jgi:hypothetical protein
MTARRIRTEEVLVVLGIRGSSLLEHLREEGLFEEEELEAGQAEELRVAATLMEELGVNAAGVEVALHLRRRMRALEARALVLIQAIEEARSRG